VFENRALRRVFGRRREEVAGGWRRLHYKHVSQNIIRVIKSMRISCTERVACMAEREKCIQNYGRETKPQGKRPLGRPREDNI
jgi:hypothetical protein